MSVSSPVAPPDSIEQLLERTRTIAGLCFADLAEALGEPVPDDPRRAKGWLGQLLEQALGADATSLPEPDFRALGVELKSLPLNADGQPRESTYVCTVPMHDTHQLSWERSWLRLKLQRVLWVPVEADPDIPFDRRRIGTALLWSPTAEEETLLREDWEELMELICLGRWEELSARHGQYLQIRPKAAHSRVLTAAHDSDGNQCQTLPRGFYLRTRFTRRILDHHYART
ncbi:DNA mismatch repair endonuclease MutH [Thiohalophilus sp.]|uniref:DNA mismatch repair endonuclease MutH n=1 Tax=Thiohalophilus sp. TaxID=3028392 RepID=UPI002ACE51A8|nr:DNA mismatch repair endonuclease MutH [Thiohalophilus sp.]MDZ7805199.1 DNA mismatch repair endonuclease MutH [Thiohalophilus sp.]